MTGHVPPVLPFDSTPASATYWRLDELDTPMFQFTRPRHNATIDQISAHATVSIHAPARGATTDLGPNYCFIVFQFTRPRGARRGRSDQTHGRRLFQFTRPRGARQKGQSPHHQLPGFNSRAREGRDLAQNVEAQAGSVSIHAPARGATSPGALHSHCRQFQFTRPRGARLDWHPLLTAMDWFQFTRPRGARRSGGPPARWPA